MQTKYITDERNCLSVFEGVCSDLFMFGALVSHDKNHERDRRVCAAVAVARYSVVRGDDIDDSRHGH